MKKRYIEVIEYSYMPNELKFIESRIIALLEQGYIVEHDKCTEIEAGYLKASKTKETSIKI